MRTAIPFLCLAIVTATGASPALAQNQARSPQQRQLQYQISTMESVLARAVEYGALEIRDRLQAMVPAEMLLSGSAHVRGFPLAGYGMVFDVAVPGLDGTLPWSFRTLDQNNLGLDSALNALRGAVQKMNDANLEQALQRVELQVAPASAGLNSPATVAAQSLTTQLVTGSAATVADDGTSRAGVRAQEAGAPPPRPAAAPQADPILRNPDEAYRAAITKQIMDAMLNNSLGLDLGANDKLTVVAKSNEDLLLGVVAPDSRTTTITVTGADLAAFRGGQISREDAYKQMTVTVF